MDKMNNKILNEDIFELSDDIIESLKQSEKDVENGNLIDQEKLEEMVKDWLKE